MDVLTTSLFNAGGMGHLADALLLLHRDAIKAFREELAAERKVFRQALRAIGVAIPEDDDEPTKVI